ncbi:MAG: aminotransferase class V-fold PLP-dependent enzyme [Planctomycetaceae bacterium]|nr:aminotransferase class V-fold PLP-dependent enzyme [Planctomycetaceae bacterium]
MPLQLPIYLDNHSTTRVDPRVVEAMLPFFTDKFGNSGSVNHSFGWDARDAVDLARKSIAAAIGADAREIVFTSGATESNNLAIRGLAERQRRRGDHIIGVTTEHKAVLDPLKRLARRGIEVTLLDVEQAGSPRAGWLDPQNVAQTIRDDTLLVSVMLANNEIGILQPIAEIAKICREHSVPLHCDATQAVGKIPVDVHKLGVDLMSFSGHKIYGPKGIGALFVRRGGPTVRLEALIDGGGQEAGLRSGTLNVPGIVGMAKALELSRLDLAAEMARLAVLRQRLWDGLVREVPDVLLNGPDWKEPHAHTSVDVAPKLRLPGNLNCSFPLVNGEALMISMKSVAVSSGSACTSANPEPSHVLLALGLGEDLTRASLRFGIGRFNTVEEIDYAVGAVAENVHRLRKLSSLALPSEPSQVQSAQ